MGVHQICGDEEKSAILVGMRIPVHRHERKHVHRAAEGAVIEAAMPEA